MDFSAITIGTVVGVFSAVVGIVKGIDYLLARNNRRCQERESKTIKPVLDKLEQQYAEQRKFQLGYYQDFLVEFMADIDRGTVKNKVEIQNFHKNYDLYTKMGGNSFVHDEYERLKKEGKL